MHSNTKSGKYLRQFTADHTCTENRNRGGSGGQIKDRFIGERITRCQAIDRRYERTRTGAQCKATGTNEGIPNTD